METLADWHILPQTLTMIIIETLEHKASFYYYITKNKPN